MPKTRLERLVFGALMASIMVYGMEIYHAALLRGGMPHLLFSIQIGKFLLLSAIVILLQELIGGPFARKLTFCFVTPSSNKPLTITVVMQLMTVCMMCPLMSLAATLLFQGIDLQIPANWAQTLIINFPMALLWQVLVAGPLVRRIFKTLFVRQASIC